MLREVDFTARLEAALALRREREEREGRNGTGHLKGGGGGGKNSKGNKKGNNSKGKSGERQSKRERREAKHAARAMGVVDDDEDDDDDDDDDGNHQDAMATTADQPMDTEMTNEEEGDNHGGSGGGGGEDPEPTIDPCQSLFDNHVSPTPEANLGRMSQKYGFFVPDAEYLTDLEGLLGYCHEKIKLGHYCLYCQRVFKTWSGCQKHMIDARHAKIRYEANVDQEEFDVFYDFTEANDEFLVGGSGGTGGGGGGGKKKAVEDKKADADAGEDGDEAMYEEDVEDDDGEWEDISDDEDMAEDEDDDDDDEDGDMYQEYEAELRTHGFDVTPLGELIFPDGRIIGHRGLSRYYKQRFAPDGERAAVTAARRAAGERVHAGRVYQTAQIGGSGGVGSGGAESSGGNDRETTLALAKAGIVAGAAAGRSGRGILVPASGSSGSSGAGGAGGFTTLSLYRYRAVVKKARREEAKGHRLQQRTKMNTNRMDKKANRLMNGVSVAHAAR